MKSLSRVRLFTTPWTAAYQAPPSMGFSRQEYWSRGLTLETSYFFTFPFQIKKKISFSKNKEFNIWKSLGKNRRRQWHPTPVLLPGKSHGWRSLVGCSPWGREESDTTERLHFHFSLSCIGEGNGNPLQCSCLENPRDGGAWWAALYGVAQSRTRLP